MVNKIVIPSAGQITDEFKILNINVKIGQKVKARISSLKGEPAIIFDVL